MSGPSKQLKLMCSPERRIPAAALALTMIGTLVISWILDGFIAYVSCAVLGVIEVLALLWYMTIVLPWTKKIAACCAECCKAGANAAAK